MGVLFLQATCPLAISALQRSSTSVFKTQQAGGSGRQAARQIAMQQALQSGFLLPCSAQQKHCPSTPKVSCLNGEPQINFWSHSKSGCSCCFFTMWLCALFVNLLTGRMKQCGALSVYLSNLDNQIIKIRNFVFSPQTSKKKKKGIATSPCINRFLKSF